MLACKGIFTQPSIAQAHAVCTGRTPKGLRSKTYCVYYTISKNACLQGHFYAAVNSAGTRSVQRANAQRLAKQDLLRILYHSFEAFSSTLTKNGLLQLNATVPFILKFPTCAASAEASSASAEATAAEAAASRSSEAAKTAEDEYSSPSQLKANDYKRNYG